MTVQRAREDGKSSHRARDVLPIVSGVRGHHSYIRVWTPVVGEKYQSNQGQLQFEHVVLLLATYRELVQWLQVSVKCHDGRLTFATLTLAMCSCTSIYPVYSLITSVNFCIPIFAN